MSTQSTLMSMSQEILLMIFIQVYSAARIHFKNGLTNQHHAPNTESWVPEEFITPMLICKYLRPIAWEALQEKTLFIFPGYAMDRVRRYSWWDKRLVIDPTDIARRVQSDLYFADDFAQRWGFSKILLPKLKELSITGVINVHDSSLNNILDGVSTLRNAPALQAGCLEEGIKLNMYLIFAGHRMPGTRQYPQSVRLVLRQDGSILVKEVRAAEVTFYDAVKQFIKDQFDHELEEMRCKRGTKLIKYIDDELDWQERS